MSPPHSNCRSIELRSTSQSPWWKQSLHEVTRLFVQLQLETMSPNSHMEVFFPDEICLKCSGNDGSFISLAPKELKNTWWVFVGSVFCFGNTCSSQCLVTLFGKRLTPKHHWSSTRKSNPNFRSKTLGTLQSGQKAGVNHREALHFLFFLRPTILRPRVSIEARCSLHKGSHPNSQQRPATQQLFPLGHRTIGAT